MNSIFRVAASVSLGLALGACASSTSAPAGGGTTTTAATPSKEAAPATPAVQIPKASSRKLVLAMTGSKQVLQASDWSSFKKEWSETFAEHAKTAGIAFEFADGDTNPKGQDGTLVSVHVEDYRMVGIGARIFFGAMTGNAYIDARVRMLDLRDGREFGQQAHNTTSSAWGGVAARMTPQQVDAIANDVFNDLKAAR